MSRLFSRARSLGAAALVAASAPFFFGACSFALVPPSGEVQCHSDSDCSAIVGVGTPRCTEGFCRSEAQTVDAGPRIQDQPKWSCVGKVTWPNEDGKTIVVRQRIVTLFDHMPIEGARFRVCNRLDSACTSPIGSAFTNAEGYVTVTIPVGFSGFYEIVGSDLASDSKSTWKPTIVMADPLRDALRTPTTEVLTTDALIFPKRSEWTSGLGILGVSEAPDRGTLEVRSHDCVGNRAENIRYSLSTADTATKTYYSVNGTPSTTATVTSSSAEGGFFNVPGGVATLTGTEVTTETVYAQRAVLVRPDWITILELPPTPGVAP